MIQQLCNIGNEHHIDTFYKVAVFEATQLPSFSNLTPDIDIENIISNIPETSQVFIADLLLNNIKVTNPPSIGDAGIIHKPNISFVLTPQDKNLQALLENYNNKEVIILVSKRNTNHLYGTSNMPLLFKYSELNNPNPSSIKGYTIMINGLTMGTTKLFEDIQFNIYNRGLAFELAQQL